MGAKIFSPSGWRVARRPTGSRVNHSQTFQLYSAPYPANIYNIWNYISNLTYGTQSSAFVTKHFGLHFKIYWHPFVSRTNINTSSYITMFRLNDDDFSLIVGFVIHVCILILRFLNWSWIAFYLLPWNCSIVKACHIVANDPVWKRPLAWISVLPFCATFLGVDTLCWIVLYV